MTEHKPPNCPLCGKEMVLRTARRGPFAGSQFWGCTGFPECKGIKNLSDEDTIENDYETNYVDRNHIGLKLDPIPEKERKKVFLPRVIELKSQKGIREGILFQSVGSTKYITKWMHKVRKNFEDDELKPFSQWRLDHPRSKTIDQRYEATLNVVEKILLRGSIIPCTLGLEKLFLPIFQEKIREIGERPLWISLFKHSIAYPRCTYEPTNFDSQAEVDFYNKLVEYKYIDNWMMMQVPISSLTEDEVDPNSKQRVDFLLAHPGLQSVVIEIDGPQHNQQVSIDKQRDESLKAAGYQVLRIKTSDIEKYDVTYYKEINDFLLGLNNNKRKFEEEAVNFEELFLLKEISQLQISLLIALKNGNLKLDESCSWNLHIISPKGIQKTQIWKEFISTGIKDFIEILTKIYNLQTNKKLKIDFSYTLDNQEIYHPDIIISFDGRTSKKYIGFNKFTISDIYLPFDIAQSTPKNEPIKINKPNKGIVEYFLKLIFDKSSFREGQWEAIERTLQGKDSILLLPTGHGKSIAFQLASFLLPGVCLVIDPLISLIDDQIDNLQSYGIDKAVGISSQLETEHRVKVIDAVSKGFYNFCYVAPERFQIQEFRNAILSLIDVSSVSLITIDEAHCVSEWGHDFRVSYLNLARNARNYCNKNGFIPPILAMTGTASRSVLRDMRRELEILDLGAVINLTDFDRPELNFNIIECSSNEKNQKLLDVLNEIPQKFGQNKNDFYQIKDDLTNGGLIFYPHVNGKYGVSDGFKLIQKEGFEGKIGIYSGKAPKAFNDKEWDKRKQFESTRFKDNEINILVCTKAFGMGIDKENIRYTIHMNLPPSIESAYQEAGRAGRDKNKAWCYLIVSPEKQTRINNLLNPITTIKEVAEILEKVKYDDDDITRQIFFHNQAFKGAEDEIEIIKSLLDIIDDIKIKKTIQVTYDEESKTIVEKGVHRLLVTGVLDDYSIDYAHNAINMMTSGLDSQSNLSSYLKYVENYDRRMAEQERLELTKYLSLTHKEFVVKLAERLVKNFIYRVIEQSRRRSLSEMLQACQNNPTNESFKRRILSYFNLSHYSEIVEKSADDPGYLSKQIEGIADELNAPIEAEELRGQTARQLQAYPNNPSLLLLRSLAEAFCSDMRREVVFENFNAYMNFSTSSWGMKKEETIDLACKQINQIGKTNKELAEELVVALIEKYSDNKEAKEQILSKCDEEYSLYVIYKMIGNINELIELI